MKRSNKLIAWAVLLSFVLSGVVSVLPSRADAATLPVFTGTYETPSKSGTITFTSTRVFPRIGYGGWVRVDGGKRQWGTISFSGGVAAMTWFYGNNSTFPEAGRAYPLTLVGSTYVGPIQFTDRRGNIIDSGTVTFTWH